MRDAAGTKMTTATKAVATTALSNERTGCLCGGLWARGDGGVGDVYLRPSGQGRWKLRRKVR